MGVAIVKPTVIDLSRSASESHHAFVGGARRILHIIRIWLFVTLVLAFSNSSPASSKQLLYVAVGGEGRVAVFEINQATGALENRDSVVTGTRPGALAILRRHGILHVSQLGDKRLAVCSSSGEVGRLGSLGLETRRGVLSPEESLEMAARKK